VFVFKIVAKVAQVVLFVCYRGNQNLVMVIENGIMWKTSYSPNRIRLMKYVLKHVRKYLRKIMENV